MDRFELNEIKNTHVGDIPAAKKGIIDSLLGRDEHRNEITDECMTSYSKGHEIGTKIENLLKGDQRDY